MSRSTVSEEPLRQHGRLRTGDVALAQQVVADVYEPHTLEPVDRSALDARLNAVQNGGLTLGYLTYGSEVRITLPPSDRWYHINIALAGHSRITREDGERGMTAGREGAAILLPHRAQTIDWATDTAQFALKIPRADIEGHLAALARTPITGPIEFDLVMNLRSSAGRGLLRCIEFVRAEWDEDGILAQNPGSRRQLESMILTNLLIAASGPHQQLLRQTDNARPDALRRALDYIHEHAQAIPTLADLTEAAGVSARTLQLQFLHNLDCTPSHYLRDVRLRAAREELLHPSSDSVTVADVAAAWGFYNHGRFSSLYRSMYGESPSETLRGTRDA
ncbi:AraC family transcriptional regulator [Streptosporangium algeriense]|uniref:AraC family transcriptional regulator n=1 Tax=Streptosporangium algeriense TaxID=1682748 RepID=A0ABW3DSK0_9ACTN